VPKVELRGKELWVKIPEDIAKALEVDENSVISFEMTDNELAGMKKSNSIGNDELVVLKKLIAIKFAKRTKENVGRALTEGEKKTLGKLMKKKAVSYYEGGKYKDKGVYSISRDYYSLIASKKPEKNQIVTVFGGKQYIITDSMEHATNILSKLENEVKSGKVISVRGFDKKIYITTQEVLENVGSKIIASLENNELRLDELVKNCREEKELVKTVIEILRESGDLIEKRRGVYALA